MRRLLARAAVLLVAAGLLPLGLSAPGSAEPTGGDARVAGPAYQQTRTLSRSIMIGGTPVEIDSRKVTVRVDRTTQLRGRERISISWSGAHPTGGRAASPFGEQGLAQEYPVVILQCRGLDDASLPAAKQLSPETCWTSTRMQRSLSLPENQAVWRKDLHATDADRAQKSGLAPIPAECADVESYSTRVTPFRAANGRVYASCTNDTMPPEAAVGAAFPPAEMAAFTDQAGNGSVKFEVRSNVENESLGCSDTVACSIVVIPIEGISCATMDPQCSRGGQFEAGENNFSNQGVDLAVSPSLWWSESNWRNRFSVPISFGLPPDACTILDSRAPTGFYGSELMAQAALQWSPAYCLDKKRFKFQHNKMADVAAFRLMEGGGAAAALVSTRHETRGSDPVAYAPTAVTGFAVGYVIDRPDNAGELTTLRLNARLLAKLLTQSYLGSDLGRGHPGMGANPLSINQDPEFRRLNPGLDDVAREAGATLLSLSEASDVIASVTSYIANDPDALAFVNGRRDPWGMVVNPSYRKISLPTDEWPLLDSYVPATSDECRQQNPTPYFTQLAAPVPSLRKIAEAILDGWPNVQTKCDRSALTDPWKIGRVDRQGVGTRFMLGLVSLGDARRLGLQEARLHTRGSSYVAPTDAGLRAAVSLARPSRSGTQPFSLDMADVVKARTAYPGTMVVYTAARTANLPKTDAGKVAQFVRISTSEGQRPGYGNGELPQGYLPLSRKGVTAPLVKQALHVADVIEEQSGARPAKAPGRAPATGTPAPGAGTVPPPLPQPDAVAPVDTDLPENPVSAVPTGPVTMPPTQQVTSLVAARLVPMLVGVLLAGSLLISGVRLWAWRRRAS